MAESQVNAVIQTHDLTKFYGAKAAVKRVNMTVNRGDIYGFIGGNGAGKTTLIRMLVGLAKPTSGTFSILGATGHGAVARVRQKVGAIVESPALCLNMTGTDALRAHAYLYGVRDEKKIAGLLQLVGIGDTGKKKVKNFSLGMRQRLAIAQALVNDPEILILDEPTNGMDPKGIIEVRRLLLHLVADRGLTILISSHILGELEMMATRYGIIQDGEMIDEFTEEQLKKDGETLEQHYMKKVGM